MQGNRLDRHVAQEDRIHVDLTSPLSAMLFPILELIVITGICWMGIGFLDQLPGLDGTNPADAFPEGTRNLIVLIWAVLAAWRFGLPLIRQRRFRVILSDRKLLIRRAGLRTGWDSIPLSYVQRVQRRRNSLIINVGGHHRPYVINQVPKARKVEAMLKDLQYW
ncbi:membrane protein [Corynebacterium deserti GIMN1.010]|uniref:Membrane protein n=1 Tax=Corynebacterium deserti GIMN1.010 TaxID=931089 RepID=A0A0M4CKL6_9CORY|nr:membrane protein [Corynebacterium deserti GIMN1.010]